jgi:hypothetical protein
MLAVKLPFNFTKWRQRFAASLNSALILSGHVAFQIEPICKRERSGSLQAKS